MVAVVDFACRQQPRYSTTYRSAARHTTTHQNENCRNDGQSSLLPAYISKFLPNRPLRSPGSILACAVAVCLHAIRASTGDGRSWLVPTDDVERGSVSLVRHVPLPIFSVSYNSNEHSIKKLLVSEAHLCR